MSKKHCLVLVYLAITLDFSSVDITYEWFSPLRSVAGEAVEWYAESGLRHGGLFLGNHDTGPALGLTFKLHIPHLPPLPLFAVGGPEGGGIFVSVWLLVGIICLIHMLRLSRFMGAPASRKSNGAQR